MVANQQTAPKQPKEPKEQVQKKIAQEQPQEQLQVAQNQSQKSLEQPQEQTQAAQELAQVTQEQPQEQPQVAQEQAQAAQEQSNEQLGVTQEQPQLTQEQVEAANQYIEAENAVKDKPIIGDRVKFVLDVIKEIKSKLRVEPSSIRTGIQDFHDKMMAESEQRAAVYLKAKEESDDSNVVTRRK